VSECDTRTSIFRGRAANRVLAEQAQRSEMSLYAQQDATGSSSRGGASLRDIGLAGLTHASG
jgi:hypothetical protein